MQKNPLTEEKLIPADPNNTEKSKLIEEISSLLSIMQKIGRRLANETHNEAYDLVDEFNQQIHQANLQLKLIRENMFLSELDKQESPHHSDSLLSRH